MTWKLSAMNRRQEKEANEFAMALLIPEHLIREDIEDLKRKESTDLNRDIKMLAKKYEVDVFVMTARLVKLDLINI